MADEVSKQNIDWEAIEATPEFQELVKKRRSFVLPGTIFFITYYMAFILLAAYAPDFMGESVYQGLTVGYVLALTQFLMVLVLGIMYLKRSKDVYDPLAEKAIARYVDQDDGAPPPGPEPGAPRADGGSVGARTATPGAAATEGPVR